MKNNDKLICLIGKYTLLLQRQTFKILYVMKKNYLFPHCFQWIGWVVAIASFVVLLLGVINDTTIRMPAFYLDVFFDDDNESGFFRMT